MSATYNYYYGVICASCEKFNAIREYETTVHCGLQDVDLGDGYPVTCSRCGFRHAYHDHDLVYSQKPDEMVPLDQ